MSSHNQGSGEGEGNGETHIHKELSCESFGKYDWQEYTDRCQCGGSDGTTYLAGADDAGLFDWHTFLTKAENIFNNNDGVIHQHADTQSRTGHGNNIQRDMTEVHKHHREDY